MAQIKFQAPQSQTPEQRFGSSYEQPFELLQACHERVERSLQLLVRLCQHLKVQGLDGNARDAARDVLRYFDIGPDHRAVVSLWPPGAMGRKARLR